MTIQDIIGGSLGEVVKDIIGAFKLDPTVKAQVEAQLAENQVLLQQKEMDLNEKLNDIAGQNIRTETGSQDKYISRARPSLIWGGMVCILWNYCVVPFAGLHWHLQPVALPDMFWWIWGTVATGYVFNRTAQEILTAPGDSQIKLPGITLSNKS